MRGQAKPWRQDADYHAYVEAQVEKTTAWRHHIAAGRVAKLARRLVEHMPWHTALGRSILAVGCRNRWELDVLHAVGFDVTGIDLVSTDPRILLRDMHATGFDAHRFDAVFSCHSLEHAYDLGAALREWARITKPFGAWVIEVPVRFTVGATDRHDVGSVEGLKAVVAPYLDRVCWSEASADGSVARLIGQVS